MFNKFIVMGRLTANVEKKSSKDGQEFITFSVATDRVSKNEEKQTDFFYCTAWGKTADFIEKYFQKGSMILLEGSMQNNNYTDKTGVKHYEMVMRVQSASFTGERKPESETETANETEEMEG